MHSSIIRTSHHFIGEFSHRVAAGFAIVALAAGFWGSLSPASAEEDAIATRKAMMQTVGFATKTAGLMVKGETEFNPVTTELAMRAINGVTYGLGQYFPDDSKTGGKTTAAPKIWEDMKGFLHKLGELEEDSEGGIKSAKAGPEAFKAAFLKLVGNCKGCHKEYRIKKKQ